MKLQMILLIEEATFGLLDAFWSESWLWGLLMVVKVKSMLGEPAQWNCRLFQNVSIKKILSL
jgi:hypothetical protein